MTTIRWRAISAIVLSLALALLFWLVPGLSMENLGGNETIVYSSLFAVFWLYLVVQGYPVSHGDIGSSSTHNLDNIISALPALVAIFGGSLHLFGFRPLSPFNLVVAVMTLLVAIYDLWVLGGAAAKINRLTDEYKAER
jgi:hypothetical protein